MNARRRGTWSREREGEEEPGRDRWLVSYADFITLLLAFFVVLYSISSVNTGKFRVLSNSLESMLAPERSRPVPIDLGGGAPTRDGILDTSRNIAEIPEPSGTDVIDATTRDVVAPPAVPVVGTPKERLEAAVGAFGGKDDVKVRETRDWIEIRLGSELLFGSGSARLDPAAAAPLAQVAAVVADMGRPVRVEGFTDNVGITGGAFSSNWALSAARAATIAERLAAGRLPPKLLAATGYGEHRPIADNLTPEGRRQNRRVVIAVAKTDQVALGAAASVAEQPTQEAAKPEAAQTLQRVSQLPGPAEITQ